MSTCNYIKWIYYPFEKPNKSELNTYITEELDIKELETLTREIELLVKEFNLPTQDEAFLFVCGAYFYTDNFKKLTRFKSFKDVKDEYLYNLKNKHESKVNMDANKRFKKLEFSGNELILKDKLISEIESIAYSDDMNLVNAKIKALDMLAKINGKYKDNTEQDIKENKQIYVNIVPTNKH